MNTKAMVTLALGESYSALWQQICKPSWQRYAEKYHLDLICGNLEQYSLSAISALAERAVAALVPR
jgi:hypothetical protein